MMELIETYWLYFLVGQYPDGPLGGLALTLVLASLGLLLALPLGVLLGLARVSPNPWLRRPNVAPGYAPRPPRPRSRVPARRHGPLPRRRSMPGC